MSKRQTAIAIMKANEGKAPLEVYELIAAANSDSIAKAKGLYKWIVQHDMAPGTIEASSGRGRKAGTSTPKAPKTPKVKMVKVPTPKVLKDKPKVTDKTVEELADIKAKNLARLKAVHRKYQKGQFAEPRFSDEAFDENAVPNLEKELESFEAPKFLTKDQVKALV